MQHDIERSLQGRGLGPKVATDGVRDAVQQLYALAIYTDILYPPQINPYPLLLPTLPLFPPSSECVWVGENGGDKMKRWRLWKGNRDVNVLLPLGGERKEADEALGVGRFRGP